MISPALKTQLQLCVKSAGELKEKEGSMTQNASNTRIGSIVYSTRSNQSVLPLIVQRIDAKDKDYQVEGTLFTAGHPSGTELVSNMKFDPKAASLSENELAEGKGTPNTWHCRTEEAGQTRAAGAGH